MELRNPMFFEIGKLLAICGMIGTMGASIAILIENEFYASFYSGHDLVLGFLVNALWLAYPLMLIAGFIICFLHLWTIRGELHSGPKA